MTLKIITLVLALVFSGSVYSCTVSKIIEDGSVKIYPDQDVESGMYHIRVPAEYKGSKLEFLILFVSIKSGEETHELSLPLSVKSKNGVTGSHFYISSRWINIRVSANYEGKPCVELIAKLSM